MTTLQDILTDLRNQSLRLEGQLAETCRLMRVIDGHLSDTPPQAQDVPEAPSAAATPAVRATSRRVAANTRRSLKIAQAATSPVARASTTRTGPRRAPTAADAIRHYIAHHQEFSQREVIREISASRSAASCALNVMVRKGEIERVGYGRYRRLPAFRPPGGQIGQDYAAFRASLGELKVPEIAVTKGQEGRGE